MTERERCIFCKIADGLEKNEIFYNDDDFIAFKDIKPAAKHHFLIIPKQHIKNPKVLTQDDKSLVENLIKIGKEVLSQQGADMNDILLGFHWPPFTSVSHLHLHAISPVSEMTILSRMIFNQNNWWFVTSDYLLSRL